MITIAKHKVEITGINTSEIKVLTDKEKEEFVAVIAAQEKDAAVKIVSGDNTEWVYLQNWSLGC